MILRANQLHQFRSSRNLSRKTLSQLKIITSTQSQLSTTITWCNTVSLLLSVVILQLYLRLQCFLDLRNRPPESKRQKEKRNPHTKQIKKKNSESAVRKRFVTRASVLERAEWGQRGAHLTPEHCVHSPDNTAREASCRPVRSTHSTRLVCVCDDPTGPVFWPRLTRALGACSPRSHPSGHALFHPGERIDRLDLAAHRPLFTDRPMFLR